MKTLQALDYSSKRAPSSKTKEKLWLVMKQRLLLIYKAHKGKIGTSGTRLIINAGTLYENKMKTLQALDYSSMGAPRSKTKEKLWLVMKQRLLLIYKAHKGKIGTSGTRLIINAGTLYENKMKTLQALDYSSKRALSSKTKEKLWLVMKQRLYKKPTRVK